jgi:hypothetical protein
LEHHVFPPSTPSTGVILAGQDEVPPEYPCPTIKHHQTRMVKNGIPIEWILISG